jgi:hypothetical protein
MLYPYLVKLVLDYFIWCKKRFGTPWHVTATEDCEQEVCSEILRIYPTGNSSVWSLIPELADDTDDELNALSWDEVYALLSEIQESDIDTVPWEDVKKQLREKLLIHSEGMEDLASGVSVPVDFSQCTDLTGKMGGVKDSSSGGVVGS